MQTPKAILTFLALLTALTVQSQGATLILDSFSEGDFDLSYGGGQSDIDIISGEFLDSRRAVANTGSNFTAKLVTGSGVVHYTVDLRSMPQTDVLLSLIYTKQDRSSLSLLGVHGFALKIVGLRGLGELKVYLDGGSRNSITIPFTSTGNLFYSLADAGNTLPLNDVHQIGFQIIAKSPDFSIMLDQITVVPESTSVMWLGIGGILWAIRRRP